MPRTSERGGPKTRARIAEIAGGLFLERGYDAVTVAEVAKAAGVSSVTVFNHFPRKEDLFLDRSVDAAEFLTAAVEERAPGVDVLDSLQALSFELFESRHPLSGVDQRSLAFYRTVAESPALVARAREIGAELQGTLQVALQADERYAGDGTLLAALFIAGYTSVLLGTARRVLGGESPDTLLDDHLVRLQKLFATLRHGFAQHN